MSICNSCVEQLTARAVELLHSASLEHTRTRTMMAQIASALRSGQLLACEELLQEVEESAGLTKYFTAQAQDTLAALADEEPVN